MKWRGAPPESVPGSLRVATLPNALSLLRIVFLAPILMLLHRSDPASDVWAFLLLAVAGASDLLDGFLARTSGSVSPSGKIVDPLADKILIGGLILYLMWARDFPWWLVALVLLRDGALMLGALLLLKKERIVFAADWTGKITTFFFLCLITVYILDWRSWHAPLTVAAAAALLLSYVSYGRRGVRLFGSRGRPAGG